MVTSKRETFLIKMCEHLFSQKLAGYMYQTCWIEIRRETVLGPRIDKSHCLWQNQDSPKEYNPLCEQTNTRRDKRQSGLVQGLSVIKLDFRDVEDLCLSNHPRQHLSQGDKGLCVSVRQPIGNTLLRPAPINLHGDMSFGGMALLTLGSLLSLDSNPPLRFPSSRGIR